MLCESQSVSSDLSSLVQCTLLLLNLGIEIVKQYLCCNCIFQVLISKRENQI